MQREERSRTWDKVSDHFRSASLLFFFFGFMSAIRVDEVKVVVFKNRRQVGNCIEDYSLHIQVVAILQHVYPALVSPSRCENFSSTLSRGVRTESISHWYPGWD
jgi:hypothetical protein